MFSIYYLKKWMFNKLILILSNFSLECISIAKIPSRLIIGWRIVNYRIHFVEIGSKRVVFVNLISRPNLQVDDIARVDSVF